MGICPWLPDRAWCFGGAAAGGHMEVLEWGHEQGCKLNKDLCIEAAEQGQTHILKWACKHGFKLPIK